MKQIYANNLTTLSLGRQGENLARQVVFDIRDLESLYGSGTVEVIHQRPGDAQPYPLAVQRNGTLVIWDVTATDTERADGSGKCELRYYVGEVLAKSKTWQTWVETAMDTPSETAPPEPEQGWVDQIISVGAAAKASADAAKADADRAAQLADEVAQNAAKTEQEATGAEQAKEAAQTAQRLAEEAQGAAEAARTAAAAAQAAAETAATDAAGAKQDAETALQSAQDAAAAAANALESIQTLYQEMQTWAQGVIQGINDAGSAAVQSVQNAGDAQVQRVTAEGTAQTANAKAQADAAAQSAADAAQSAHQAAESAAVYDDVVADVNQLKQDLTNKLPKSPANWGSWTAEEQAAARERMGIPGDYELIEDYTITEEDVSCASESGDITIERTAEPDGTPYKFDKVFAIIRNYTGINKSSVILFDLRSKNVNIIYSYAMIPGNTKTISFLPIYENGYVANRWFYDGLFRGRDVPPYRNKICTKVRLTAPFPVGANIEIYGVRA